MRKFTMTIRPNNSIGGNNMSAPIYWQSHGLFREKARSSIFADFLGGSPDVASPKSQ
jgi:hypothetical protein